MLVHGLGEAAGSVFHVDWWLVIALAVMNGRRRVSCRCHRPVPKTGGPGPAALRSNTPFMFDNTSLSDLS
jgi:hypothetical protein